MAASAHIYIVDDDQAARDGLVFMLGALGLEIRSFAVPDIFLAEFDPDVRGVCLFDMRMPGMTGLELLEELNRRNCLLPVIFITGHGDVPLTVRAMRAGAYDFVEKPVNGMELLERINEALRLCDKRRAEQQVKSDVGSLVESLTPRERQVAQAVMAGKQNKMIAHELGISMKTVEIHRHNAMEKLGATSAADLVRKLMAAGWQ
ncbi:response regulator [Breoghania sp.]|uniref:response regulator transcription factor n=1 Tax=Breoghania sp. TaxID=2065378 RepID=UPI002AA91570|nr:response regulator [Breoghania sp.]